MVAVTIVTVETCKCILLKFFLVIDNTEVERERERERESRQTPKLVKIHQDKQSLTGTHLLGSA